MQRAIWASTTPSGSRCAPATGSAGRATARRPPPASAIPRRRTWSTAEKRKSWRSDTSGCGSATGSGSSVSRSPSENGKLLFTGKISDLERSTGGGFTRGRFRVQGLGKANGELCEVEFQNENLIARRNGALVATVPDLISVLESDTGQPVSTEELRYGQRISVIGIPCAPILRTAQALAVVGPGAFGYREDFVPLGEYVRPKPAGALAD